MMDGTIDTGSRVIGLALDVTWYSDNPGLNENGKAHFLDHWCEIIIASDASNPFFIKNGNWRICVVWKKNPGHLNIHSTDNSVFVQLNRSDELRGITLSEEAFQLDEGTSPYGVWCNIFYLTHDGCVRRHAQLISRLSSA